MTSDEEKPRMLYGFFLQLKTRVDIQIILGECTV